MVYQFNIDKPPINYEYMSNRKIKYLYFKGLKFPYQSKILIRFTLLVWVVMVNVLFISVLFFNYEITNADIPCGGIAGVLLAYLIYVSGYYNDSEIK